MSTERTHGTLLRLGSRTLATSYGAFRAELFRNLSTGMSAAALVLGDVGGADPLLARVHSSCVTSETFAGCDCDCAEQLATALAAIAAAGRGVMFYLLQEGRGAGLAAKARDRMLVQASDHRLTTFEAYRQMGLGADQRRYDEVAWMQRLLGIEAPLELLSSNPEKAAALGRAGVSIRRVSPMPGAPTPWNRHYIAAKSRSGHSLREPGQEDRVAELPERVESYEPRPVPGAASLVDVASYLLPIRFDASDPTWFRVHAYFDLEAGSERVVLTHRRDREAVPLASLQSESLLDRFPLAAESPGRRRWRETFRRIVSAGAGAVLFRGADGFGSVDRPTGEPATIEDVESALLASHLPGRARLSGEDAWLARSLGARGIHVEGAA